MKLRMIGALLAAALPLLLIFVFAVPVAGTPPAAPAADIVLGGADTTKTTSVGARPGLLDAIEIAGPRPVVDYANTIRRLGLPPLVAGLQAGLDRVAARVVVDAANTTRGAGLPPQPVALQSALNQVAVRVLADQANTILRAGLPALPLNLRTSLDQAASRVVFDHANTSRAISARYPAALIGDTTLPSIESVAVRPAGRGLAVVTWHTDEFADSEVRYGEQPGQYKSAARDPIFVTQHAVTMTLLIPNTTYYFQVSSADQSDNVAVSPEYTFAVGDDTAIYLPLLMR